MIRPAACLQLVRDLPSSLVQQVIDALRHGGARPDTSNPHYAARIEKFFAGVTLPDVEQAAALETAVYAERERPTIDLVWTGPTTPVLPARQTEQVLLDLIRSAERSLTVISFGVMEVRDVVTELLAAVRRGVAVRIVLGEKEESAAKAQIAQLGPWLSNGARIYRWLARRSRSEGGLMHVKAAISDRRALLLSSANLTGAALRRNMELGVLIRGGDTPQKVDAHIDALIAAADLVEIRP